MRRRARKANAPRIEKVSRTEIIERDKSTCYLCMRVLLPTEVTLDHVIPLAKGGSHTADNLRVACSPCNKSKATKVFTQLSYVKFE
jgi:5-methylcytosine-specific restriction endonuclease McrA